MLRLPLALAVLLAAASVSANNPLTRYSCGCNRSPIASQLSVKEITSIRAYVQQLGVTNYGVLSDDAIQAIWRFNLMNNFKGQVPSTRTGLIQVVTESLGGLKNGIIPSQSQCGKYGKGLYKHAPLKIKGGNFDYCSLLSSAAVVFHQRGLSINLDQLNILLRYGLERYRQSTIYQSTYSQLLQLIISLDYIDSDLHIILNYKELIAVRQALILRFKIANNEFDNRYRLAVRAFKISRNRLLRTLNHISYRGPYYEVLIQRVIVQIQQVYRWISVTNIRSILDVLQITNTFGGVANPSDLLGIVTVPKFGSDIYYIAESYIQQYRPKFVVYYQSITVEIIQEYYSTFILALASQGVEPLNAEVLYYNFYSYTLEYFQITTEYSIQSYLTYVIRTVVPALPRNRQYFRLSIYGQSVVIDNILVPRKWVSIYKKSRKSIIRNIRGPQGSSKAITKRIIYGTGEQEYIKNDLNFAVIVAGNTPGYDTFEYQNVVLRALYLKQVASELSARFIGFKSKSYVFPLLRILVRANLITGVDAKAAAAFRRLFHGIPVYQVPDISPIFAQLSQYNIQLTEVQLRAGLQQFYIASRSFGINIPEAYIPRVFLYCIREYYSTLVEIPAQPFDDRFLEFLYLRLQIIIKQFVVVGNQPIDDYASREILSVLGINVGVTARRSIIKFIGGSGLLPKSQHGVSVIVQYQQLFKKLIASYPTSTFLLKSDQLGYIRSQLINAGIQVDIKQLRDINVLVYVCLGLNQRFEAQISVISVRQIIYSSIRYFLRTNKIENILSGEYLQYLLNKYKIPVQTDWDVPVDQHTPIPETEVKPYWILPGIEIRIELVYKLVVILQSRFTFVTIDNCQSILAHTIWILRSTGVTINSDNCYDYLSGYYNGLPQNIGLESLDIEDVLSSIDSYVSGVTVTETSVQSALVELCIHLYSIKAPLPSVSIWNNFFRFVIGQYGRQVRQYRRLPLGGRFYGFLKGWLPKARYQKPAYIPCHGKHGYPFFKC